MSTTSIILHAPIKNIDTNEQFINTIQSIISQLDKKFNLIVIGNANDEVVAKLDDNEISYKIISSENDSYAQTMNKAFSADESDFVLYIDNRHKPVSLKMAALSGFLMAAKRNADAAMFYADYDLIDNKTKNEIKLLFHHSGRVRDNQDYGLVYLLRKTALMKQGMFDEKIEYNSWYDMRLKLSENYKLIRIANKYSGSFYTVFAEGEQSNVFDYLLASKDVQLEAEKVLTNHLKRINAYLKPGSLISVNNTVLDNYKLDASVIIPVGFRPEFIGIAIESIQNQTRENIEAIIMVNGGEEDPTAVEVRKYMLGGEYYDAAKPEIRLLIIDINSIGLCLNMGANIARGKYYVQLDSDDRLKPDAVEKIVDVFESDDKIGMVIGSYEVWEKKEDGTMTRMDEIPVVTHDEWTDDNGRNNLLRINGAGAPRSIPIRIIKEMGYFSINDDAYARNYGEDYEMVNKIAEYYKIGRVYDPIYDVVRHSGGTDHAISQDLVDRNDEAKDDMRKEAIARRIEFNSK